MKPTTGARRGLGWSGSNSVTVPGDPLTSLVRTPACSCCLPPGPPGGWAGGAIALVVDGAVVPAWSRAGRPFVQPATASAASRHAKPRPHQGLGPPRPALTLAASMNAPEFAPSSEYIRSASGICNPVLGGAAATWSH